MPLIAHLIRSTTDFADQAVIIPTCLAIIACLCAMGWRRAALAMVAAAALTEGSILGLKLLFASCDDIARGTGIFSPSGHTAGAALVGGSAAVLIWARHPRRFWIALGCAAGAAFLIGATRVALRAHTVADVAMALPLGVLGAAAIARYAGAPSPRFRRGKAMIVVFLVVVVFYGNHLHAETFIAKIGKNLECAFD